MLDIMWVLLCSGLVFLMQAGFMCLESGLTRSKNSINVAVKNLVDLGASVLLFWMFGYAIMFGASTIRGAGAGAGGALFFPALNNQPQLATFFLFQAIFCGTATTIISGAVAERMTFYSYLIVSVLVSGLIYPVFGRWAWHGLAEGNSVGWLEHLGFVDFAGSTVVHSTGAWVGLAAILILGPRQGRFTPDGKVTKIQGTSMPLSVLGAFLLWFGWIGFNGGSTLAFTEQVPGIVVNTILAGVAGLVTAGVVSEMRYGLVEVESLINGGLAGLVAITACCHVVTMGGAVLIGTTGAIVALVLEQRIANRGLDDVVGAISVHGGAGVWGTLCVALFGNLTLIGTGLGRAEQVLIQLLGIGVSFAWSFGLSWTILVVLNRFMPLRVTPRVESMGLNVSEHGAKTDTYELFQVMDQQARTQDLSLRVPVEPFTEVGHIATRYNQVMTNLEHQHQEQVDDLEQLYYLAAVASAAVESRTFRVDALDMADMVDRHDELGTLARILHQLIQEIQNRDALLDTLAPQLDKLTLADKSAMLRNVLQVRFGSTHQWEQAIEGLPEADFKPLWQSAISTATADEFMASVHDTV